MLATSVSVTMGDSELMSDRNSSGGSLPDFDPLAVDLPPAGSMPLGVGKEQVLADRYELGQMLSMGGVGAVYDAVDRKSERPVVVKILQWWEDCLLYTSPSPRDGLLSRMPSSA